MNSVTKILIIVTKTRYTSLNSNHLQKQQPHLIHFDHVANLQLTYSSIEHIRSVNHKFLHIYLLGKIRHWRVV